MAHIAENCLLFVTCGIGPNLHLMAASAPLACTACAVVTPASHWFFKLCKLVFATGAFFSCAAEATLYGLSAEANDMPIYWWDAARWGLTALAVNVAIGLQYWSADKKASERATEVSETTVAKEGLD